MTDSIRHTIAVVDDDYRMLESLESLLESAGHAVRLFPSAEAFLEAQILSEVDCLISDIGMTGMDGVGLLQAAQLNRPGLPVILITGRDEPAEVRLSRLVLRNTFHEAIREEKAAECGHGCAPKRGLTAGMTPGRHCEDIASSNLSI